MSKHIHVAKNICTSFIDKNKACLKTINKETDLHDFTILKQEKKQLKKLKKLLKAFEKTIRWHYWREHLGKEFFNMIMREFHKALCIRINNYNDYYDYSPVPKRKIILNFIPILLQSFMIPAQNFIVIIITKHIKKISMTIFKQISLTVLAVSMMSTHSILPLVATVIMITLLWAVILWVVICIIMKQILPPSQEMVL